MARRTVHVLRSVFPCTALPGALALPAGPRAPTRVRARGKQCVYARRRRAVLRPRPGRAVVAVPRVDARLPERVDLRAVAGAEADVEPAGHRMLAVRRTDGPVVPLDQLGVRMAGLDDQDAQHGAVEALGGRRSETATPTWSNTLGVAARYPGALRGGTGLSSARGRGTKNVDQRGHRLGRGEGGERDEALLPGVGRDCNARDRTQSLCIVVPRRRTVDVACSLGCRTGSRPPGRPDGDRRIPPAVVVKNGVPRAGYLADAIPLPETAAASPLHQCSRDVNSGRPGFLESL